MSLVGAVVVVRFICAFQAQSVSNVNAQVVMVVEVDAEVSEEAAEVAVVSEVVEVVEVGMEATAIPGGEVGVAETDGKV